MLDTMWSLQRDYLDGTAFRWAKRPSFDRGSAGTGSGWALRDLVSDTAVTGPNGSDQPRCHRRAPRPIAAKVWADLLAEQDQEVVASSNQSPVRSGFVPVLEPDEDRSMYDPLTGIFDVCRGHFDDAARFISQNFSRPRRHSLTATTPPATRRGFQQR